MSMTAREFGSYIVRLIGGQNLARDEMSACFREILLDSQSEMQQGAFLSALAAKGETAEEIAAVWNMIYELDTAKVTIDTDAPLVENCGTGMDSFKTFNISTAASIIAAADGVTMAKHGARAITSKCGTVDILEELGVNVECAPEVVKKSIETAGIGIFNGMSPLVHPQALGRILSKVCFGTVLNIAASLANPAMPKMAVRGVYCRDMLRPTAGIMREIGFDRAIVIYGDCGEHGGIDEASTIGETFVCELAGDGSISEYSISPEQFGIKRACPDDLRMTDDKSSEARRIKELLVGKETQARTDIVCLNAGLILYLAGRRPTLESAFERANDIINSDKAIGKLNEWICVQR